MPEIIDTFPADSLDTERWNESLVGVSIVVDDGITPDTVDDDTKSVLIDSLEKFSVPPVTDFDMNIEYGDVTWAVGLVIVHHFGWRSYRENDSGDPWSGVEVLLSATLGTAIFLEKRTWVNGVMDRQSLTQDDTLIAGALRIARVAGQYILYYEVDGEWVELDIVDLGSSETGYVAFGQFAEIES